MTQPYQQNWTGFSQHKGLIIAFTLIAFVASVIITLAMPHHYQAESLLRLQVSGNQDAALLSEVEILKSREVLEQAVEKLNSVSSDKEKNIFFSRWLRNSRYSRLAARKSFLFGFGISIRNVPHKSPMPSPKSTRCVRSVKKSWQHRKH